MTAIVATPITITDFASAVAQETQRPYYGYGPHMWDGGDWFFGPFMMLLFLGVLVAIVVLLVRWLGGVGPGMSAGGRATPLDVLRERYARGEIDKAEFEERKGVLGG
jgi:putative membrane protein